GFGAWSGNFEYRGVSGGVEASSSGGVFGTDDDGRFRLALPDGESVRIRLHVELFGVGRKVVDVPEFERARGQDIGDVVLERGVSVPFRVRDESGEPLAGAFAKHEDWKSYAQTDARGDGFLPCVAPEGATLRFGSRRHEDKLVFVRPGERLDVVLE